MILFTNGIKLGEQKNTDAYLISLGKVDRLNLSLDAGTTETLHKIKPGSKNIKLEDILEAAKKIKDFSKTREGRKRKNRDIDITASYVITKQNYFEILEFVKKTQNIVDKVKFRIDLTDRSVSQLHNKEIIDSLKQAKYYETENFKVIPVHSENEISQESQDYFSSKSSGNKCYISRLWTCIGPNGNLYPCGHIACPGVQNYGSLLKKDLSEIWDSKKRKKVINGLPTEKCDVCSPFSLIVNRVVTDFSKLSRDELKRLHEVYC